MCLLQVSIVSLAVTFIGIDDNPTKIISHGAPTTKYFGSLAISLIAKIDESMGSKYKLNFSLTGPSRVNCCFESKMLPSLCIVALLIIKFTFQSLPISFAKSIDTFASFSELCGPMAVKE